jgi:hypothetical protein
MFIILYGRPFTGSVSDPQFLKLKRLDKMLSRSL